MDLGKLFTLQLDLEMMAVWAVEVERDRVRIVEAIKLGWADTAAMYAVWSARDARRLQETKARLHAALMEELKS